MKKKLKTREQVLKEKTELYNRVVKDLAPLISKYGMDILRLAIGRWANRARIKNALLRRKGEIETELKNL